MNEIRNLIIGIDLGADMTQLCYYDRKAMEPRSVTMKVGSSVFEAPTALAKKADSDDFAAGIEVEYFVKEKAAIPVPKLYERLGSDDIVDLEGISMKPYELAKIFIHKMLEFLGVMDIVKNTSMLVIACREFDAVRVRNLAEACRELGFQDSQFRLIDYSESFYYYAMTLQREPLSRSIAWYEFADLEVTFRKLSIDRTENPASVVLGGEMHTMLPAETENKDRAFAEFIDQTIGGHEMYANIQLTGYGFSQEWAKESIKILCRQRRKVYVGNNLYARGACACGKDKKEDKRLRNYRFLSPATIVKDVGMEVRTMGSNTYFPLVESGNNWYECRNSCEFILDHTEQIEFLVKDHMTGKKKKVFMELPGLPRRPNKTTRLGLSLEFISQSQCSVTITDIGFGEMFPSSGMVWKEIINW